MNHQDTEGPHNSEPEIPAKAKFKLRVTLSVLNSMLKDLYEEDLWKAMNQAFIATSLVIKPHEV